MHGLKSAMFSIGANKVSEMAKQLELAGKEDRISYIEEHHQELMNEYEALFRRLVNDKRICPDGEKQEEAAADVKDIEADLFDKIITNMEDAMYAFDEEIMMELVEELDGYSYRGNSLQKILGSVKRKIEMSDYISAVELIANWKKDLDSKENS